MRLQDRKPDIVCGLCGADWTLSWAAFEYVCNECGLCYDCARNSSGPMCAECGLPDPRGDDEL